MKKIIGIDLDGTICTEHNPRGKIEDIYEKRKNAVLIDGALESLKKFKENGYYIIIYTGRNKTWYKNTEEWLINNNVPFDELICGKPVFDAYIGNEAYRFNNDWDNLSNIVINNLQSK